METTWAMCLTLCLWSVARMLELWLRLSREEAAWHSKRWFGINYFKPLFVIYFDCFGCHLNKFLKYWFEVKIVKQTQIKKSKFLPFNVMLMGILIESLSWASCVWVVKTMDIEFYVWDIWPSWPLIYLNRFDQINWSVGSLLYFAYLRTVSESMKTCKVK